MDYEFEEWEGDSLLIEEEDWIGLIKLRKRRAEKRLHDLHAQWSYAQALIFNNEFKPAIEFLTVIHKKDPYYPDVNHSIIEALYGLGKTENDFDWIEKPLMLKLNNKTKEICKDFLKKKRKPISFLSLYEYLMIKFDYIKFQEEDLFEYLKTDNIFEFSDNKKDFFNINIKLLKN